MITKTYNLDTGVAAPEHVKPLTTRRQKMKTVEMRIRHLDPCIDAAIWAKGYTSPAKAWQECKRGDWMLWLLGKLSGKPREAKRKKLVLCCCECARLALPIYEKR